MAVAISPVRADGMRNTAPRSRSRVCPSTGMAGSSATCTATMNRAMSAAVAKVSRQPTSAPSAWPAGSPMTVPAETPATMNEMARVPALSPTSLGPTGGYDGPEAGDGDAQQDAAGQDHAEVGGHRGDGIGDSDQSAEDEDQFAPVEPPGAGQEQRC
jgi:hypothetical protein